MKIKRLPREEPGGDSSVSESSDHVLELVESKSFPVDAGKPGSLPPSVRGAFEPIDRLIAACPPEQFPAVVAALSARLGAIAARALRSAEPGDGSAAAEENISIAEAARRLGVSEDYLYRARLPFKVRIGRRVLVSLRGLERWIRQRQNRQ